MELSLLDVRSVATDVNASRSLSLSVFVEDSRVLIQSIISAAIIHLFTASCHKPSALRIGQMISIPNLFARLGQGLLV